MPVIEIESYDDLLDIINNNEGKDVMVDFYAEWCKPCMKMLPSFLNVSDKHSHVIFVKINVDIAEDAVEKCKVSSIPNILYFSNKNNQSKHNKKGALTDAELDNLVDPPKINDDF